MAERLHASFYRDYTEREELNLHREAALRLVGKIKSYVKSQLHDASRRRWICNKYLGI
ncbi:MAG: hypothetical protein QXK71_05070 [Pyrobaculum sp.]|jgi:hypothetical protein|uniref:hypothetical protein n=1 Tax=Pyrobaculum aerophilum TaxID=13773 RepID=UPI0026CDFE7E|nr:hypothetical protein [Pyrobaculum aerophilum]